MEQHFLDNIRYVPNEDDLLKRACLDPDSDEAEDFLVLVRRLAAHARPKAFVMTAVVDATPPPPVLRLNGVEFLGSILHELICDAEEVGGYLVTCGVEMYDEVGRIADPFERFWGEIVLEDALYAAQREMEAWAARELFSEPTAAIAPGSLPEWPISQQTPLFQLLGDGPGKCGITLTDSLLMVPNKSISGILFPNPHNFSSCALCGRENCPNRKAPHNPVGAGMR